MITVQKVKQILPISKNIEDSLIFPQINLAEQKYIKPVMGDVLFADIQVKYSAQTLNTIETTLVGMAQISLAYYIVENTLPFLSFQMTEKGVQIQNGVNSQSADAQSQSSNLNYMRNELRNNAEFFSDELRNFLYDNRTSFSLYTAENNDPKLTSSFDCGIAFFPPNENITPRGYFF